MTLGKFMLYLWRRLCDTRAGEDDDTHQDAGCADQHPLPSYSVPDAIRCL
jgi:hypothetical protein